MAKRAKRGGIGAKILSGTFRPDRENPELDIPDDPAYPRKPQEIQGKGRIYWHRHIKDMVDSGKVHKGNVETFTRFCMLQTQFYKLYEDVQENGWSERQPNGARKIRTEAKA